MLNRITSVSVNAACPAANEIAAGANPAKRTAGGSRNQSSVVVGADQREQPGADDEPGDRAEQAADDVLAGAQGVRAQDGERAEHDPERVLDAGQIGDEDGEAQADRTAHAVVQPNRVALDVGCGPLLRGRQRAGHAGRLMAEQALAASSGARRRR